MPRPSDCLGGGRLARHPHVFRAQDENEGTEPFGFNFTDPAQPLEHPWTYFSCAELGMSCERSASNAVPSYGLTYPPGGYVAIVIPFFSPTVLPEQKGTAEEIIDFKQYRCDRTGNRQRAELGSGSATDCVPRYLCVRLSWNGRHLHQLCDPMDSEGRVTGVVRAAIEDFWGELKRGHFIDARTRFLEVVLPLRSNHMGLRCL